MNPALLYESPYTDFNPRGLEAVCGTNAAGIA